MDKWNTIGAIKRGSNRLKVFMAIPLDKPIMPNELVRKIYGKVTSTDFATVSRALKELKDLGVLFLLSDKKEKTGRLYKLTKQGIDVRKSLDNPLK